MSPARDRNPRVIQHVSDRGFPYAEIVLDNTLGEKLGGPIPDDCLWRAEQALEGLREEYLVWVRRDLDRLEALIADGLPETDEARAETILQLRQLSHDMRGQGGTFGYPLVSQAAGLLTEVLKVPYLPADRLVSLVRLHADVIRRILAGSIQGDGGEAGRSVIARLHRLTEEAMTGGTTA